MKRLPPSLPAFVLFAILALSSCAMLSTNTGGLTAEQAQAGVTWLDATLARFETAVAAAKAIAPEHADAIEAAVGAHLEELRAGLATVRERLAAGQTGAADAMWKTLRPLVSTVAVKLAPYAIGAISGS